MSRRFLSLSHALVLWCATAACADDGSPAPTTLPDAGADETADPDERVPTHLRVVVDGDFPYTNVVWLDIVIHWESECTSERWFVAPNRVSAESQGTGGFSYAYFPMSFDVLPQNDASMERVTVMVAGIGAFAPVAVDSRTVQFKPGERVTAELFLSNPCAPRSCDHTIDDYLGEPGESEGVVEDIDDWCAMSPAALQSYRPYPCSCGVIAGSLP